MNLGQWLCLCCLIPVKVSGVNTSGSALRGRRLYKELLQKGEKLRKNKKLGKMQKLLREWGRGFQERERLLYFLGPGGNWTKTKVICMEMGCSLGCHGLG